MEDENFILRNPDTIGISRAYPPQPDKNSNLKQKLGKLAVFVQALHGNADWRYALPSIADGFCTVRVNRKKWRPFTGSGLRGYGLNLNPPDICPAG